MPPRTLGHRDERQHGWGLAGRRERRSGGDSPRFTCAWRRKDLSPWTMTMFARRHVPLCRFAHSSSCSEIAFTCVCMCTIHKRLWTTVDCNWKFCGANSTGSCLLSSPWRERDREMLSSKCPLLAAISVFHNSAQTMDRPIWFLVYIPYFEHLKGGLLDLLLCLWPCILYLH